MSPARWMLMTVVLAGWLGTGEAALAANPRVNDEGKFFSAAAVEKANAKIAEIRREFGKDLLIDTVPAIPADMQDQLKQAQARSGKKGRGEFFQDWAIRRAKDAVVQGIYILICKDPSYLQIDVDNATRAKGFTPQDREQLNKEMRVLLGKKNDAALADAVNFVQARLRANLGRASAAKGGAAAPAVPQGPPPRPPAAKPNAANPLAQAGETPWLRWVLIGAAVLLGIWILMAVLRGLAAAAGGGGGGRGVGGGGGGGGGGGFLGGMLGGLFGAAAGNWLYDSFARGGHSSREPSQAFGGPAQNQGMAPTEPGAGDFSGDAGSGGDFGDSGGDDAGGGKSGGDDTGGDDTGGDDTGGDDAGGGDFGGDDTGGGDTGGGGDFEGDDAGGGDFGGDDTGGGDSGGGDFGGGDSGGGGDGGGGDGGGGDGGA
jgi:hypothetical protein